MKSGEGHTKTIKIPESLVYERIDGVPIYSKGYKEFLSGSKSPNEVTRNSYLQFLLVTELCFWLKTVFGGELGLQFDPKTWRAADIAVYEKDQLKGLKIENKYLAIPPNCLLRQIQKPSWKMFLNSLIITIKNRCPS